MFPTTFLQITWTGKAIRKVSMSFCKPAYPPRTRIYLTKLFVRGKKIQNCDVPMAKIEIEKFCDECREETEMRFIENDNEYLIYECSVCDSKYRFLREDIEEEI